jgi:outer membrane protein assembly factor BamA
MLRFYGAGLPAIVALLFVTTYHGTAQTNPTSGEKKVLVESFVITGTQSIGSEELAEITTALARRELEDDPEILEQRVRALFQDRGFFKANVDKLEVKTLDPLASPKPVSLEAQVTEGPRCYFSTIEFTGNHALTAKALRAKFPLEKGQPFRRSRIAAGLETMRELYGTMGFLDMTSIPQASLDSTSSIQLAIDIDEGPQYHMDKFKVFGSPEVAEKLQVLWELEPGAVFDESYLKNYLERNRSLLPSNFIPDIGVERIANCPDSTVSVHLHLKSDSQHETQDEAKRVDCSSQKGHAK